MASKKDTALAAKAAEITALAAGYDYGDMAGDGWDNTDSDDFTIPFLTVLQAMSPQVDESDGAYIEGAKAGMLLNTASNELYSGKDGVEFVPCLTQHLFVEWKNRQTDGGGFIGIHECDAKIVAEAKAASPSFGKYTVPVEEGTPHDLVETFYIYGLLVKGDEILTPCMLSFNSTKIKAYKAALTPLRHVKGRPPLFAFRMLITTKPEKNAKGSFYNFKIVPAKGDAISSLMAPDCDIVLAAKEFKDQASQGKAKVDHGGSAAGDGGSEAPAPF